MSASRRPSLGVSTVTTIALNLLFSTLLISLGEISRFLYTYQKFQEKACAKFENLNKQP